MQKPHESELRALIDSTDDPMWSVDLGFATVASNRAALRVLKHSALQRPHPDRMPAEPAQAAEAAVWPELYRRALGEGPFTIELAHRDGSVLEYSLLPIVEDGRPAGVTVVGRNIGKRRAAELAHRGAEDRFRSIFENALEGIFQSTLGGKVLAANPALALMLGFESVEQMLLRVDDARRQVWIDRARRAELVRALKREQQVRDFECQFRRKDGSTLRVSVNARLVRCSNGDPLFIEGYCQDVTQRMDADQARRMAEERYRAAFEQSAVGIVQLDRDFRVVLLNQRAVEIGGYPPEEMIGADARERLHPDDRAEVDALAQKICCGEIPAARTEARFIHKDGTVAWLELTGSPLHDQDGTLTGILTILSDITKRKEAEQQLAATQAQLRDSEERYRIAFETAQDAVNINRLHDGLYIESNPAFLNITGYTREEVVGRTSVELNIWADLADRARMVEMVASTGFCRDLEAQFRRKNGELFWGMMFAARIELKGEPCILSVTRDMSKAKLAEEEIRNLAFYDPLTALPNRRLLLERLRQVVAGSERTAKYSALLFVDLDNFKTLNDTLGHHIGDQLLKAVAQRLAGAARQTDTVARLGGDEFVVMLENLSESAEDAATLAGSVAEGILASLSGPCLLDSHECVSTCSIGITVFGDTAHGVNEILKQADIAMYQAKAAGRNSLRFFAPELQAAVTERAALEDDLRQAIRDGQFELWYQPQVSAGRLVGAEALLRWRHPRRGILAPGEFIGFAEESGLIVPLGTWVLERACQQIAAWSAARPPVSVAVNISARQFRQPDFVDRVLDALERSGANPELLTLELTESMLLDSVEEVIGKMTALKLLGVHFSLDDFGTGYSSLTYLKRLPLDQLKVDRSFVQDILDDPTSGAIAQTIVSLSRAMNLSVLAEGVETKAQWRFLTQLGCVVFQGYLFSRPLPAPQLEGMLQSSFAGTL